MRSWIPPPTRLAGPVMIVQLPIRSPSGDFHVLRRPAKANGRRSGSEKCIGLRGCFGILGLEPLVPAVGGHEAAAAGVLDEPAERRALGERLHPRVDAQRLLLRILGPVRDEPPAQDLPRAARPPRDAIASTGCVGATLNRSDDGLRGLGNVDGVEVQPGEELGQRRGDRVPAAHAIESRYGAPGQAPNTSLRPRPSARRPTPLRCEARHLDAALRQPDASLRRMWHPGARPRVPAQGARRPTGRRPRVPARARAAPRTAPGGGSRAGSSSRHSSAVRGPSRSSSSSRSSSCAACSSMCARNATRPSATRRFLNSQRMSGGVPSPRRDS